MAMEQVELPNQTVVGDDGKTVKGNAPDDDWDASVIEALHTHNFADALRTLNEQTARSIESKCWDLLPLCFHSFDEYKQSQAKRFEQDEDEDDDEVAPAEDDPNERVFDEVLLKFSRHMTPKDLIMTYLTTLPRIKTSDVFQRLARSVSECLASREPNIATISWILSVFANSLEALPAPPEQDLDDEERILMDGNSDVQQIVDRYRIVIDLLEDSLHLVNDGQRNELAAKSLRICAHVVRPLAMTLGLLDLSAPKQPHGAPSAQYSLALRLKRALTRIMASPVGVLQLAECLRAKNADDELVVPSLSGAVLAYVMFCLYDDFPRVYSVTLLADLLLNLGLVLVSSPKHMHILKGVSLINSALPYVKACVGDENDLAIRRVLRTLLQVMTTCSLRDARESAMPCWQNLYARCRLDLQVDIVRSLFKSFDDPSIRGFLIDEWRKLASRAENAADYHELIDTVVYLPDGVTTDLLRHSEHIIASLNVLRFAVMTKSFAGTPRLDRYLADLKKALEISRAHYKLQLETPAKEREHTTPLLPSILPEMETDMLNQALIRFDLIEFVLASVRMDYDARKRP